MSPDPIGVEAARQRGASNAEFIFSVEPVGAGDLLMTTSSAVIHRNGDLGRPFEKAVVRLSPADVTRLINLLTLAQVTA